MTTTASPTTAPGRVSSASEPAIPSGGKRERTPIDRDDWWSRSPCITAAESVERYFRFMNLTFEVNRRLALSWTGPVGWPPGTIREQSDTAGRPPMPKQPPTVTQSSTATRDPDPGRQVTGAQVANTSRARTGRNQQPHRAATTPGQGDRPTGPGGPGVGVVDGLIGHLLDREITGSLSINR